jgi:hypothetical protein
VNGSDKLAVDNWGKTMKKIIIAAAIPAFALAASAFTFAPSAFAPSAFASSICPSRCKIEIASEHPFVWLAAGRRSHTP